jgi:hypothetical protein
MTDGARRQSPLRGSQFRTGNDGSWPIGEVHDRPLIQCTTGSSATSAEEVKRDANESDASCSMWSSSE